MIKANELRLGNIFSYKECYYFVSETHLDTVVGCNINGYSGGYFEYSNIKPIPLIEDWILKSGKSFLFRFQTCWRGRFAYLKINGCRFMWFSDTNTIEVDGGEHILYFVHEFQNLYFALTGEELVFSSTEP